MIIKRESRKNHCLSWLLEHSELLVCGAVIGPHEMAKNACGCWSESASGCVWVDDWTVWQWPGIWCLWGDVICVWILLNWCLHKLMFSTKQQPSSYQGALFSIYFCPPLLSQPLTHVWVESVSLDPVSASLFTPQESRSIRWKQQHETKIVIFFMYLFIYLFFSLLF